MKNKNDWRSRAKTSWEFERFKTKKKQKPIEGKSNNQSRAAVIFNDIISKTKSILNELYESVDKNKLKFEYVGNTKDVRFYKCMDSKELFNKTRNGQLKLMMHWINRKVFWKN